MPFFANNRRLKGVKKIEMGFNWFIASSTTLPFDVVY